MACLWAPAHVAPVAAAPTTATSATAAAPATATDAAATSAYVPGELLVKFRSDVDAAQIPDLVRGRGAALKRRVTPDGLVRVELPHGSSVLNQARRWSALPDVEYAAPNVYVHGFFIPNDSLITNSQYDAAWNLRKVGAFRAWDFATGSPDVVLAIIDTGVAFEDHPVPEYELPRVKPGVTMYLRSPDLSGPFLPGYDFVNEDDHPNDDHGHGTQCATVAAGQANNIAGSAGIAFGVTILPVKVLDFRAEGTADAVVSGIRFAADQRADIANLSLGIPPRSFWLSHGLTDDLVDAMFAPFEDAVRYARRRGTILVAAAGNFARPDLGPPASCDGVIAVGAITVDDSLGSYSSYGEGLDFVAPGGEPGAPNDRRQDAVYVLGIKPYRSDGSLAAPDSFGVFPFFQTSAAAPHVSGAVALLMSQGVRAQHPIERLLRETAIHPFGPEPAWTEREGYGLIQIDKAVEIAASRQGRNPHLVSAEAEHGHAPGDPAPALVVRMQSPTRGGASLSIRLERAGLLRIRLYDVRGNLVRTVADAPSPRGVRTVHWDGSDEHGARVGNGVYFFRVESEDGVTTRRIAVLN